MPVRPASAKPSPGPTSGWERFYRVIRKIPAGKVATYGAIAKLAGEPRSARQVGYALAALFDDAAKVPWQRVLGARGRGFATVTHGHPGAQLRQRALLEAEGVEFDASGRVSLARYGWNRAYPDIPVQRGLEPRRRAAKRGRR